MCEVEDARKTIGRQSSDDKSGSIAVPLGAKRRFPMLLATKKLHFGTCPK
jgi:hypothetical protein